jgi:hypothetical protein
VRGDRAELARAPLFFAGHSAGGPQAKAAAAAFADRCFGLMQFRGGAPSWDPPLPAGIPTLMMLGQFDEFGKVMRDEAGRENWAGGRDSMAQYRARGPDRLGSIVVEPGAGHFAWSDRSAAYFSMFLRAAARARIPAGVPRDGGPVMCRRVDPAKGFLTDLALGPGGAAKGGLATKRPVPARSHAGDGAHAWHIDRALAEATLAHHRDLSRPKDQFIRWTDAYTVDAGARFFFTAPAWIGDAAFDVHPIYADTYPTRQPNGEGPRWLPAGQPVTHAAAPILVRPIGGPLVAVGRHTFEIRFDALAPAGEGARATFIAYSEGDAEHRYTEHVGMLQKGFAVVAPGAGQLAFPPIGDLRPDDPPLALAASSENGKAVRYYVAAGPAKIVNGKLTVAEVPDRARFPMTIKVVAYQVGPGPSGAQRSVSLAEQAILVRSPSTSARATSSR